MQSFTGYDLNLTSNGRIMVKCLITATPTLAKFLSNCEKNNSYDVIEDEIIFPMVVV